MKKITITSRMTWSNSGVAGAIFFVISPFVGAIGWNWYLSALAPRARGFQPDSGDVTTAATLCFVAGLAWLVGCLLVFYGRTYTHQVEIGDGAPATPRRSDLSAAVGPDAGMKGPPPLPNRNRRP
jgi:hypothetical protein